MTSRVNDAKLFVEGVTRHLKAHHAATPVLPAITAALARLAARARMEATATVESAVALRPAEKQHAARLLARALGRQPRIEYRVNRALIGGIKMVVGDWVVDTSLASQLAALREELAQA